MHIFKEDDSKEKITYMERKLVSLKWMPEPVRGEGDLRAAT
jgi:hypothetical protein